MWMVHSFRADGILLGQIGRLEWELALPVGAMLGVVALGAWAIYRVKCWREELAQEEPLAPQELLDHYQQMVDDGLLDPQEFARIKARLELPRNAAPSNELDASPPPNQPPDTSFFEK